MKLSLLIYAFFLLFPLSTYAETIDLVCTDPTGFSVNFEVNTSAGTVQSNGIPARNVFINKNLIKFTLVLNGEEWVHFINRSTGNLTIQGPNKRILPTYKCERAKPKF